MSPPQPGLSPVLAVRPFFLAFCRGAILGPGRFGDFLDSFGTWGGSRLRAPLLRPFSRTRGGKGASLLLLPCFVFPRFVLFCGCTLFLVAGRAGAYTEPHPGQSKPAPRESDPQGSASRAEGWSPPVLGFLTASFGSHRVTGTPWAFLVRGGGAFSAPLGPFHTHLSFVSPPQVVFFLFFYFAFEACEPRWIADAHEWNNRLAM